MSQFILELRQEKKLTQKELADQLNVTDKAVSKWERGLSYPDISLLPDLAQVLGVTTGELINGEKAETSAPKVEAMVDAALGYADAAVKKATVKSTRWKYVAVALASILILIGCSLAIDRGLAWSVLPINIIVVAWIMAISGGYVMEKNKLSSLLLCGLIIFLTTFFYSSLNLATERDVNLYGVFDGFKDAYIPHYTIIIIMFVVSTAVAGIAFWIQSKKFTGDAIFLLAVLSLTMMILAVLTLPAIMDYVDIHGLAVKPLFTLLLILVFLMNCVSLAVLAKHHRRQVAVQKSVCSDQS